jgi:tetratricopeptide (TPR) repeat protein
MTTSPETSTEAVRPGPDSLPMHYFEYGLALERQQDWPGAADAYREAIDRRRKVPAWWYYKLAQVLRRLERYHQVAETLEQAIAIRESAPPGWLFLLGRVYERLGRWDDVRASYQQALDRDPASTEVERRMLAAELVEFPGRRTLTRFVAQHLDEITERAAADLTVEDRNVIYSYWAQGFDDVPDVVRLCHRRLHEQSSVEVVDLDEAAMSKLIKLPGDVDRGVHPTHRSDLLRLELLSRYGGTWIDATCLVNGDPGPRLAELRAPSGFFSFGKRRTTFASWLLTSTPNHYLVRMLREALHTYWRHHDRLTHYFILHYMFEALTQLDARFAALWQATPRLSYADPFQIRWRLLEPYQEEEFQRLWAGSFVHKLTYKYEPEQAGPHTFIGHLLRTL